MVEKSGGMVQEMYENVHFARRPILRSPVCGGGGGESNRRAQITQSVQGVVVQ